MPKETQMQDPKTHKKVSGCICEKKKHVIPCEVYQREIKRNSNNKRITLY